MKERPRTHTFENAERVGELYLADLGLAWEELQGKKVLDIGAGPAEFENAARRRGIEVVSMDNMSDLHVPPRDSRYVVAEATQLPFNEGLFDIALSHMSVTNYGPESAAEYTRFLQEVLRDACRVLKRNGEFRFMDTRVEPSEREDEIVADLAARAGFREVRRGEYDRLRPVQEEYRLSHFYIATK